MIRIVSAAVLLAGAAGCASLSTDVTIPEKKSPQTFAGASAGPSAAGTSWREWFADARLAELVGEALRNNQDLEIALQRVEVNRAMVAQATGNMIPQVALGTRAGIERFGDYTDEGAGNAATDITPGRRVPVNLADYRIALESSWEIDLWGRLRSLRGSAVARHLASIEGMHLVRSSLVADVATAYFELLALDQVREVLRQSVASQEQALEVVKLQKEAGRANELAVQQFAARLAETRALEREIVRAGSETENRINLLLGRYPQPVARDREALFTAANASASPGVPSELLANRPDVRQAELELEASKLDLRAARAAFFPSLTLTAGLGFQAFNPAYLLRVPESVTYAVGGGLLTPLINWRALEFEFEAAKASQIQAMYNYQRAILVAYVEVVNALNDIRHFEEILELKQAQKAAMEQTVSNADLLYRAGKATYLEVLVAQESALRARLDLVEAWKRRRGAHVVLYKALGGGWR